MKQRRIFEEGDKVLVVFGGEFKEGIVFRWYKYDRRYDVRYDDGSISNPVEEIVFESFKDYYETQIQRHEDAIAECKKALSELD